MEAYELAFKDDESIVRGLDETVICLHGVEVHRCKSQPLGSLWIDGWVCAKRFKRVGGAKGCGAKEQRV